MSDCIKAGTEDLVHQVEVSEGSDEEEEEPLSQLDPTD